MKGRDGKDAEGKQFLSPLIEANALLNAQATARRTRKSKETPKP